MNVFYKIEGRCFSKWKKAFEEIEAYIKSVESFQYIKGDGWMLVWCNKYSLFTHHLVHWCKNMNEHLYLQELEIEGCY